MKRAGYTTCATCGSPLDSTVDGLCAGCLLQFGWRGFGESGDVTATAPQTRGQRVGEYELLGEIARGGMGVVYRARQLGLEREVALKMILVGQWASEAQVQRFRLEARASARLEHPNIVPIYDFGEHEGWHFFSLKLIDGEDLGRQMRDGQWSANDTAGQRRIAQLLRTVAEAVHFAHQRGILHRDLKPTNILIAGDGTPYLTDFGLAKLIEETSDLTHTSSVLGTPAYMAPELAAGRTDDVTVAADVYSLGAVLYELLTGQPPHLARTPLETLRRVVEQEAAPVRRVSPAIASDLGTICDKCLRTEPAARYSSARELAEDLERWLRGEPVRARPVNSLERAGYWARRNPATAGLLGGIILVLIAAAIISSTLAVRMRKARDEARLSATENLRRLVELQTATAVRLAQAGDPVHALPWLLEALRLDAGDPNRERPHRTRIASLLAQSPALDAMIFHDRIIQHAAFSPDGRLAATASFDGTVRITDTASGLEVCPPLEHTNRFFDVRYLYFVAFSPDGRRVVSSCNHEAQIWDVTTGRRLTAPLQHTNEVRVALFSPDGTRVLTGSLDGTAQLWNAESGEPVSPPLRHERGVLVAAWSPDGKIIATGGRDQQVRLWDAQTGESRGSPALHGQAISHLTFSPDSRHLLAACQEEAARIYRTRDGNLVKSLDAGTPVRWASFSPDGQSILAGGEDGEARLWNWATDESPLRFPHPNESVVWTGWSADGRRFLTAGPSRVQVWERAGRQRIGPPLAHNHVICHAELSPDGRQVLTGCLDGTGRVWRTPEEESPPSASSLGNACGPLARFTIAPDDAGQLRLRDLLADQTVSGVLPVSESPEAASYSATSQRLAVLQSGRVRLFDCGAGALAELAAWPSPGACDISLSPDGEVALLSVKAGHHLVRARTGEVFGSVPHGNTMRHAVFHPDGRRLLTVCEDKGVRVWDWHTCQLVTPVMWHTDIVVFGAFSPDGQLAVTTSYDGTARLWNLATGQPAQPPFNHVGLVAYAGFSADGRWLVTWNEPNARVWDLTTGRPVTSPMKAPTPVAHLDFLPDRRHLLMVLANRTRLFWELPSGQPLTLVGANVSALHTVRHPEQLPVESRPLAELHALAILLAGHEIQGETGLVPVDASHLRQAWKAHLHSRESTP